MVLSLFVAFVLAFVVIVLLLRNRVSRLVLDQPNHRSLHTQPIPRLGGLAVMAGSMVGWMVGHGSMEMALAVLTLLLGIVSFLDDVMGISVRWRFLAHFLVTSAFVWMFVPHAYGWWAMLVLMFLIVWMTNLFNFMDGSDGLAGGMSFFGFGSYCLVAWMQGDLSVAAMSGSIAAASLAFLRFNFHPARIFMGDAGSIPLGFLSAALGVIGWQSGLWPIWFPVAVFSPFIVDATVTLLKRLLRGEKVWEAHREHYYQRLVQLGWGHRRTAIAEYALMLVVCGTAILAIRLPLKVQAAFCLGSGLAYFLLIKQIDKQWAAQRHRQHDED